MLLAALALPANAQVPVQQALDKQLDFAITDKPIQDVFAALSKASGARFVVDADTIEYLPFGEQTHMTLKLTGTTLRKDLAGILAVNALQWTIDGDAIKVIPTDPLYRTCRRATFPELTLLGKIATLKIDGVDSGGTIESPLGKAAEVKALKIKLPEKTDSADFERAKKVLPGTAGQWLDTFCMGQDNTWYIDDATIVIIDRKGQIERQLQRRVSLRYQNSELAQVLIDLIQRKGHVPMKLDPGVLNTLPAQTRSNYNLLMGDAPIATALEFISGNTGLKFDRLSDGIHVSLGGQPFRTPDGGQVSPPPRARSSYYVKMFVSLKDGKTVEIIIPAESLPEDVQQAIEAKKQEFIKQIQEQIQTGGGF